jgi:hypothetical protein
MYLLIIKASKPKKYKLSVTVCCNVKGASVIMCEAIDVELTTNDDVSAAADVATDIVVVIVVIVLVAVCCGSIPS